jgi:hypothetical protein
MHPAAQQYSSMSSEQQKAVQLRLCERALEIWEQMMPEPVVYKNKLEGKLHFLEVGLLREAILSVKLGKDHYKIQERFIKPMSDLQDGSIVIPENAKSAYFAIRNLFAAHILLDNTDPWLVLNQALAALDESDVTTILEWAVASVV